VINYTSSEGRAKALVDEIKKNGGQAVSIQANVGEVDGPKKVVDAAVKAFGKIDILISRRMVVLSTSRLSLPATDFPTPPFTLALRGLWNPCRACGPPSLAARTSQATA
jgi:3-oxoacyl-[acyl-carrier protein] reductase